eukprot:CAMPEP_0113587846 /NCGR_PEP_ID=MMETSP0015_2-20120614/35149_1 /TAXON_ID=2838 /ORGANISM="Odontella" /LENGTH=34 /DNA_ID=CAMNT_0000493579 /DNA_START=63 /DNA_END=164 /DNA_ORIENTATION=- /assembly_acc=CAM_ASM_000160
MRNLVLLAERRRRVTLPPLEEAHPPGVDASSSSQ